MLEHGGRLRAAAQHYGIALSDWLDLSTGINPHSWPVPTIPPQAWARLPEDDDGLENAACAYYGARSVLAVAGSQAAIQVLPQIRQRSRIAMIAPSYNEHAHAWRVAGHDVVALPSAQFLEHAAHCDVAVVVQPNNPTGTLFEHDALLKLHERLRARNGLLVIDEAFMDATPQHSFASHAHGLGIVVLRSLGKFFGLAGARVGFVLAEAAFLTALRERLGPWAVAGPSRWVATQALHDTSWHVLTRTRLATAHTRLARLLTDHGLTPHGGGALFQWVCHPRAAALHAELAGRAILTRLFHEPPSIRFGLPAHERDWQRLATALSECRP